MGILDRFRRREPGGALPDRVAGASRVRCLRPRDRKILHECTDRREIAALAAALRTEPMHGYCMCMGTLVFEFEGIQPESITLHHGVSVRWEESGGNLALLDPDAVMDWLSARGIGFVRSEYEEDRRRGSETTREAERWRASLPASLAPFFDEMWQTGGISKPEWNAAVEAELPDPIERARVLLDLFGSGVGRR